MTINIHTLRSPIRFGAGFIYAYFPKGTVTGFYLRVWHRELWVEWDVTP
jgi:hypothetical protein